MLNRVCLRAIALGIPLILGLPTTAWAKRYELPVLNFTGSLLIELYVSPNSSDEWGDNQLPATPVAIAPGEQVGISVEYDTESCEYDVRGVFAAEPGAEDTPEIVFLGIDLCQMAQESGITFFQHELYADLAAVDENLLRVVNNTEETLLALQPVSPAAADPVDVLGNTYLAPQEFLAVPQSLIQLDPTVCIYDLNAYFTIQDLTLGDDLDPSDLTQRTLTVDVCGSEVLLTGDGPVQTIAVNNSGETTLAELYVSPSSTESWGIDQLVFTLPTGRSEQVPLPIQVDPETGTCQQYDVQAVFYNNPNDSTALFYERYGLDLCQDDLSFDFSEREGQFFLNGLPSQYEDGTDSNGDDF